MIVQNEQLNYPKTKFGRALLAVATGGISVAVHNKKEADSEISSLKTIIASTGIDPNASKTPLTLSESIRKAIQLQQTKQSYEAQTGQPLQSNDPVIINSGVIGGEGAFYPTQEQRQATNGTLIQKFNNLTTTKKVAIGAGSLGLLWLLA